jgi:hypothetical protein
VTDPTPLPITERFAQFIEGLFRLLCACFADDPETLALIARILNRIRRAGDPPRAYNAADRIRRGAAARPARPKARRSRHRFARAIAQQAQAAPAPPPEAPPLPIVRRAGQLRHARPWSMFVPMTMTKKKDLGARCFRAPLMFRYRN